MANGAYDVICSAGEQLAPMSFLSDQAETLTPENLEKAQAIATGAENSIEGIAQGIKGLGNILSVAASSGELNPDDTVRIGWLLSVLGDSLDGFRFAGSEAEHLIRESKDRAAKQE